MYNIYIAGDIALFLTPLLWNVNEESLRFKNYIKILGNNDIIHKIELAEYIAGSYYIVVQQSSDVYLVRLSIEHLVEFHSSASNEVVRWELIIIHHYQTI